MRLFLDANILFLAGYSADSPVHLLLALAGTGECELLSSEYAFEEARRNLAVKGPVGAVDRFEALTSAIRRVPEARGEAFSRAREAHLPDASDIPILAAALQCAADGLVTGDRRAFGAMFGRPVGTLRIMRLRDALNELLGRA